MKTILLIDDDQAVLSIFGLTLEQHGYRVIKASAGDEGLTLARRHYPDLILCDVNMPDSDGRTVLQSLRQDPDLAAKQFVLMTGDTKDVTARTGMELGADDFLAKPFTAVDLIRCVKARLRRADVPWRVEDRLLKNLRTNLHSTLPHEFFTPLAVVLGLIEVLRGDIAQLRPVEVHDILDDIERSGLRLHRTLKNYLLIADLETASAAPALPFEMSAEQARNFIAGAIDNAAKRHRRSEDVSISISEGPQFRLPPSLATIVEELVENAFSFSRKGTPIVVELSPTEMTVTDRGRGMTQDEIREIGAVRRFDRTTFEQQGLGLGLVLVKKLMAQNGGKLEIQSEVGECTKAIITFGS